jgi:hypothetical protein
MDRPVLGPSSINVLRWPVHAIARAAHAVDRSSGERQSRSSRPSCPSLGRSEPEGGRGRSGQMLSDLGETVTSQFRASSAVESLSFSHRKPREGRLGGSAASLPVRGFM